MTGVQTCALPIYGVIVGVVDEGFDFTHPNYYDADGENYRVLKVWSQVTTTGTAPSGYTLGSEYTTKEEILALETDNDEETHGTHTSGIAAGSGYKTQFMGVAPESDIILVATDMSTTGIMDGIQYIVDNAKDLDKPCVINLSLGSEVGPHDGTSIEDQLVDKLVGPGIVVVGACGNSGEDTIHIKKSFTGTAGESISTFLAPSSTETSEMYLDIWGRNNSVFDVTVSIYNYQTGQTTYTCNTVSVSSESTSQTFSTTNNEYYVAFENQLYSGNGDYNSLLVVEAENYFTSPEYVVVTISCSSADVVNMWATNGYLRSYGMSGYTAGDTDMTVGAVGGVGKQVISVGAYCTKTSWTDLDDQVYSYSSGAGDVLYAIAPFSSKGPTADDRIKPDIAAPGFGVVSGFNSYNSSYGQSCTESVATEVFNSRNYYWGVDQGTSMACPVITGTVALWLENNPKLTPDMIKNIFSEYSFASNVTRSSEKDNEFG